MGTKAGNKWWAWIRVLLVLTGLGLLGFAVWWVVEAGPEIESFPDRLGILDVGVGVVGLALTLLGLLKKDPPGFKHFLVEGDLHGVVGDKNKFSTKITGDHNTVVSAPGGNVNIHQYHGANTSEPTSHGADTAMLIVGSRPRLPEKFVARVEMAALRAALEQDGVATVSALQGMRGAGKSLLAAAYAQECENQLWRFVGWVDASSREQVISELAAGARDRGISDEDDPAVAARALVSWLNNAGPDSRLLVFDNVNNADDISDLIPRGPGMRVIITTTKQPTALGKPVEVGVYTPQQAIDHLQDLTRLNDEEGAAKVAEDLGRLPLALTQAAVVINNRGYGFARYRELLHSGQRLNTVVAVEEGAYPELVGVALRMAYDSVLQGMREEDPDLGHTAELILGALSLLAESGVPREWLRGLASDGFMVDKAVGDLVQRSILTESQDRRVVSLHRLQAQVIREDHAAEGDVEEGIKAACNVMRTAASATTGADHVAQRETNREVSGQLAAVLEQPHSRSLTAHERWLDIVASALFRSNELQDPYPAIDLASYVDNFLRVLGPDHPDTLRSRNNLAYAYKAAGNLGQAIPLYKQTLADMERVLGPDHPDTLRSRNNLASAYQSAGDLGQAIPLYKQTLADRERVLGPNHPDTLTSRNNLAYAYESAGDLGQAIPLYKQTLADTERVLGPDHPNTLTSRNNLASAYQAAGDLGQAIPLYKQTLADTERVLGPDHPNTLTSRNNLAYAYQAAGDLGQAIPLYKQTLADTERVLGPDHPDTLTSRNNLAGAYQSAGDLGQAIPLYKQTLADRKRVLGPDHPDTLTSRNNLAYTYRSAGDLGQAIPLYKQTLADTERVLGPDHPNTLTSRNNLASAYWVAGKRSEALRVFETAAADAERLYGLDHNVTRQLRSNRDVARRMLGQADQDESGSTTGSQ